MSEHTPGPWKVRRGRQDDVRYRIQSEEGVPLAMIRGLNPLRAIANARLIASAPELLSALELAECELSTYRLLLESVPSTGVADAINTACAAITKARMG